MEIRPIKVNEIGFPMRKEKDYRSRMVQDPSDSSFIPKWRSINIEENGDILFPQFPKNSSNSPLREEDEEQEDTEGTCEKEYLYNNYDKCIKSYYRALKNLNVPKNSYEICRVYHYDKN